MDRNLCPAQMVLEIGDQCSLIYHKKHMGHSCTPIHTNLPSSVQSTVADLLNNQMNRRYLISQSKSTFQRYLTNDALSNISKKFKINLESKLHSNDHESVRLFVEEFQSKGHHILCYKKLGEKDMTIGDGDKTLKETDFLLGECLLWE